MEVALDLALQATPGPPVGDRAPRVVHRRSPTARSRTPRTRRRSTRTSTRSTSTATPTASTPRCCGSSGTGWTTACGSSASTTRTPSRSRFWEWLLGRGPQDRPGRAVPRRGVHPAGDDADAGPGRLPPVLHVLHLAQREVGARGVPHRAVAGDRALPAAQLLRQHPRHPARVPAVRRPAGVQDPGRRWPRPLSPTWGVYSGYELFEHVAVRPGSEEYLDSEKFQLRPRDWAAAEAEGRTLAPYLTLLNELRRAAPRAAAAAQPALPRHRQRPDHLLQQGRVGADDGNDDVVLVVVNLDPHGARETTVRLDMPALGLEWDDTHGRARRDQRRQPTSGASANYVRLDPFHEPAHVFTRRAPDAPRGGRSVTGDVDRSPDATRRTRSTTSPTCPRRSATRTGTSAPSSTRCWSASFNDSNGDGTGDLRGLTEKLDYLQWLGVDCIWLPPFFRSPLRDGGYDVSDYTDVLPEFGTIGDFVEFVDAAHSRGIRVIIDFVMNHTSRPAPVVPGLAHRPRRPVRRLLRLGRHRRGVRRRAHHLRRHRDVELDLRPGAQAVLLAPLLQPPAGPQLREPARSRSAMIEALKFWLDLGIDGFRLDAVPVPVRGGGHQLREPPADPRVPQAGPQGGRRAVPRPGACSARPTSGRPTSSSTSAQDGDECQMAFHFPVMPRLFMGVRRESRYPISEILAQTPAIPDNCQWGIFLRNHDELTLEMVTDDERDYMWGEYAKDPRMKANIGIRRRLAPLLDNDRNQLELFTALLLSLPGSPVLYYGDEIGMGDNIWLGDRDGVRTPMQWTPDRNAGFSTGNPRPALPAGDHGPGLRLPGAPTSRPSCASSTLAAALDPADDRGAQAEPGVRPRHLRGPRRQQPVRAVVRPRVRRRRRALRQQPVALPAAGRARPAPLGGLRAGRAARHACTSRRSASCRTC